ncbi:RnfABCDGE type electron transport complex subunit D [candidate division WOR-3 bacterium]|nr:RnfABCDGE type electron transport complex subunit D [candidate division WOR-3 bacterium]MCK4528992.1 RnfABCDGE type electron transport complex subunit D [candidate division WOR-3 bacterium]
MLQLSPAPHISSPKSTKKIMYGVIGALIPALVGSVFFFGWRALFLVVLSVLTAVATEWLFQLITHREITCSDGSAIITGILVAFNIPVNSPWWIAVVGSFFAIFVVKQLFGGLGYNIFNPALAGRAFLVASWPSLMTGKWSSPVHGFISGLDGMTQATPLTILNMSPSLELIQALNSQTMLKALFVGNVGGCLGETSCLLLLIGALFLFIKRYADWRISLSYIGSVFILSGIFYLVGVTPVNPVFHILSGGVILGGLFMATDMVTSPVTTKGVWIFGIGGGIFCVLIRIWGGYPEGVSYSILIMNMLTPLLDRLQPRIFGR